MVAKPASDRDRVHIMDVPDLLPPNPKDGDPFYVATVRYWVKTGILPDVGRAENETRAGECWTSRRAVKKLRAEIVRRASITVAAGAVV